ncbi:hypothetical protein HNR67_003368 [Crossiella cryophila]|uniref:Uncharacterized protein n=2 Tax=Crossiella cryophila TaxID=43355 RepID=A0A7W7CA24_9PSEU|nr:hypothetical protein [Crossiella cryophila]
MPELQPMSPMPFPELSALPGDTSMRYGMGTVDASGRVAERTVVRSLSWQQGDRLQLRVVANVLVLRAEPLGQTTVVSGPYVAIPAPVRIRVGIRVGDRVLLAAAPAHEVLLVLTSAVLDVALVSFWQRQ